jgi:serine/threonine-protein kinase RsbT
MPKRRVLPNIEAPPNTSDEKAGRMSLTKRNLTVREEVRVPISIDMDIVTARQKSKEMGARLGFSFVDLTLIATAVSELARNIILYGGRGHVELRIVENGLRNGLVVVAEDNGRGIEDIPRALQDGYSTSGSLGLGLPGTRRLMDEFEIVSAPGKGTTVMRNPATSI